MHTAEHAHDAKSSIGLILVGIVASLLVIVVIFFIIFIVVFLVIVSKDDLEVDIGVCTVG